MTAEFAVVLPSVMLVLALCLGAVNVIGQQVVLGSLASSGARMLARGDDPAAVRARVASAAPGASLAQSADGSFVCVALAREARFGPIGLGMVSLSARDCALAADAVPAEAGGAGP
ncbi:TadE family type IV pilus minor pilin [Gryllotalpicola protaetiae]|uniref:TadE family type IV pilus minor pilin n=1 Tax=Gryllotalpicola protaetiae TaxID=2419771 RepID=UPI0013C4BC29|nr:TadE family type IV pilus minor pilin [Gryllotalpicola protaetiae]